MTRSVPSGARPTPLPWRSVALVVSGLALAPVIASGCDGGDVEPTVTGPPIVVHLVDSSGSLVPMNQPVVLQFNRFLNPASVSGAAIQLVTSGAGTVVKSSLEYDPVLLQVTLSPPTAGGPWLVAGQAYEVSLPVATATAPGVKAIDGAVLASAARVALTAGAASVSVAEPTMHFCADIWPFLDGKCGEGCHQSPSPPEGLELDSPGDVSATAVGLAAHESNVGPTSSPSAPGVNFGVDMPIIAPGPGGPGNSWILYKVLLGAPSPASAADTSSYDYACAFDGTRTNLAYAATAAPVVTSAERARLSNFIEGREMPYPPDPNTPESRGGGAGADALTIQEMERLRLWIQQGAHLETTKLPDGGSTLVSCLDRCDSLASVDAGGAGDAGTE